MRQPLRRSPARLERPPRAQDRGVDAAAPPRRRSARTGVSTSRSSKRSSRGPWIASSCSGVALGGAEQPVDDGDVADQVEHRRRDARGRRAPARSPPPRSPPGPPRGGSSRAPPSPRPATARRASRPRQPQPTISARATRLALRPRTGRRRSRSSSSSSTSARSLLLVELGGAAAAPHLVLRLEHLLHVVDFVLRLEFGAAGRLPVDAARRCCPRRSGSIRTRTPMMTQPACRR